MSFTMTERQQEFLFGEGWEVAHYENSPYFLDWLKKIQEVKAVEWLGTYVVAGRQEAYLIEVKDFRDADLKQNKVAGEVAKKVHDSLCGLVARAIDNKPIFAKVVEIAQTGNLTILFFLEPTDGPGAKQELRSMEDILRRKLSWLNATILVVSSATVAQAVPALQISNLPRPVLPK